MIPVYPSFDNAKGSNILHLLCVCLMLATGGAGFSQSATEKPRPPTFDEGVPPPSDDYALGPDSLPKQSVPAGKIFKFELQDSKIFPGTQREVTVYVPAAYKGDKPACVYVGLDDLNFNVPTVFDNLITQHAMPVTIAIGLSSGTVASANPPENPRFDRSFEFDSLDGRLARFLLDEVIPEVEQHRTPDGFRIVLSNDPNDRAIGGASTGGIGAFTVAWERPDAFRRVFTAIGTFVGMRGGEQYYVLVRKTEPKPIRIFMQDGVHDGWGGGLEMGDWWMSNQTMNRALAFAGYDVRHVWGAGTHNGNHAAAIFPDAMRWLWSGWPSPIEPGHSANPVLQAILEPQEDWKIAAQGCLSFTWLSPNAEGKVFYQSGSPSRISEIPSEGQPMVCPPTADVTPFAFGPAGKLYVAHPGGGLEVTTYPSAAPSKKLLAEGLQIRAFTVRNSGDIYVVAGTPEGANELWFLPSGGKQVRLDAGIKGASGIAPSPDGLWLFVAQSLSRSGLSYRIRSDGTVDSREPFYDFYVPSWADDSGVAGISMDREGRAYAATRMGVQVFDRNGRVTAILPLPGNVPATGICFGGPDFDTLYVAGGGRIYKRKLHVAGALPFAAPVKLPRGNAG